MCASCVSELLLLSQKRKTLLIDFRGIGTISSLKAWFAVHMDLKHMSVQCYLASHFVSTRKHEVWLPAILKNGLMTSDSCAGFQAYFLTFGWYLQWDSVIFPYTCFLITWKLKLTLRMFNPSNTCSTYLVYWYLHVFPRMFKCCINLCQDASLASAYLRSQVCRWHTHIIHFGCLLNLFCNRKYCTQFQVASLAFRCSLSSDMLLLACKWIAEYQPSILDSATCSSCW